MAVSRFQFDCVSALRDEEWRSHIRWPRSLAATERTNRTGWQLAWDYIRSRPEKQREVLMLVGGRISAQLLALSEAARVVARAAELDWIVEGGPPAVRYLIDGVNYGDGSGLVTTPFKGIASISYLPFRIIARSLMLTPPRAWQKLPFNSDAIAINHNPLMHEYSSLLGKAVRFHHAEDFYRSVQKTAYRESPVSIEDIAIEFSDLFVETERLPEIYLARYRHLAASFIRADLLRAATDVAKARNARDLPASIWIGSSGYYPARLIAQEVRRRGGSVTGFEHGWGAAVEDIIEPLAFGELGYADHYVAATDLSAELFRKSPALNIAPPGCGEIFESVPQSPRPAEEPFTLRNKDRHNIVYAPTIISGFRQISPPNLPDPVYLDWQFRVCEAFRELSVDFCCRPHPEGFYRGQPHPLAAIDAASPIPFERLMPKADIFVFDWRQSTTFGRALCSNKPIILFNTGVTPFTAEIDRSIRERCTVLDIQYDEENRPLISSDLLRLAIDEASRKRIDPSFFQKLMRF